jgi:hypothetical protein
MFFEKAAIAFFPQQLFSLIVYQAHLLYFELSTYGGETASTGTKKLRLHTEPPASS